MSKRASTVLDLAARWRSIAINRTRPEPSATSSSGPPSSMRQVNGPPMGPRSSTVLCGEPNVDVLAGNMPRPPRHVQHDGLGPLGLVEEAADGRDLPPSRYSSHTWSRQEWPLCPRHSE